MSLFDIQPIDQNQPESELVSVFREIWDEREHVSQISGAPLNFHFNGAMFFVFSHLHSRGSCPSLRLSKENIWLKTYEEHSYWEHNKEQIRLQISKGLILEWKPCLDEYDRLKPICNQLKK